MDSSTTGCAELGRDIGTFHVSIEVLRSELAAASGGVVDEDLLDGLEELRRERMDKRVFAAVVVGGGRGRRVPGAMSVQEVGGSDADPRQLPVALVVGRHSQCDFSDVDGACLRHAVLLAHPPRGGAPAHIEAIDLATGVGLGVGAARGSLRISASRRLRFGVGTCTVLAFLAEPEEPLFPEGAKAVLRDLDEGAHPSGLHLTIPASDRQLPTGQPWLAPHPLRMRVGAHSRTFVQPIAGHRVEAGAAELERGLLLGRFERCHGHRSFQEDKEVSRVHALLLRRGGRTLLVDCASMYGTRVCQRGGPERALGPGARVASLTPRDEFQIASFTLRWVPRSDADG